MNFDSFNKNVGVQGVVFLALVAGAIFAELNQIELSSAYTNLLSLAAGFYFAKNGVGVLASLRGGGK